MKKLITLLCLFLVSCSSGPKFKTLIPKKADSAIVYIYRTNIPCGAFEPIYVAVNGKEIVNLYNQQYSIFLIQPGKYLFTVQHMDNRGSDKYYAVKTYDLKENEIYFLRYFTKCNGLIIPVIDTENDLSFQTEAVAISELKEASFVDLYN